MNLTVLCGRSVWRDKFKREISKFDVKLFKFLDKALQSLKFSENKLISTYRCISIDYNLLTHSLIAYFTTFTLQHEEFLYRKRVSITQSSILIFILLEGLR